MHPPVGYQSFEEGEAQVVAQDRAVEFVRDAIDRYGTLSSFAAANSRHVLAGRTRAHVVDGPGRRWVIRHGVRGGRVAKRLGDRYVRIGTPRPVRELRASVRARALGIDTPEVVACATYPDGPFYRSDLATIYIEGAVDLATLSFGPDRLPEPKRAEGWRVAGQLIHSAARAGLVHPDLNLKNIVVTWCAGAPRAHLLDLDRARLVSHAAARDLKAMLARFERSIRKFERRTGRSLGVGERDALNEGLRG